MWKKICTNMVPFMHGHYMYNTRVGQELMMPMILMLLMLLMLRINRVRLPILYCTVPALVPATVPADGRSEPIFFLSSSAPENLACSRNGFGRLVIFE